MPIGWYVVQPPTDGSSAITVKNPSASMSGQQPEFGPMAASLKPYSFASFGHVPTSGPVQATMKKVLANFSKEYNTGSAGMAAEKAVMASLGQIPFLGNAGIVLKKPSAGMNGHQAMVGQVAIPMKKLENAAFSGIQTQSGGMGATVKKPVIAISGDHSAAAGGIAAAIAKLKSAAIGTGPQEVQISSTGLGNINDTEWVNNRSVTWGHNVVAGANQRMIAVVAHGHNTWVNPSAFAFVTTVDGVTIANSWTLIGTRLDYGNDFGWRLGHLGIYGYVNPPAGAWSITVSSNASQTTHRMIGNSRVYDNVASVDSFNSQITTGSAANLALSVTPGNGDMALMGFAASGIVTVASPTATPWYSGGSSRTGDLDYWDFRDVLGTNSLINYTGTTGDKIGAFTLILRKA